MSRLVADLGRKSQSTGLVLDVQQTTLVLKVGPRSLDHQSLTRIPNDSVQDKLLLHAWIQDLGFPSSLTLLCVLMLTQVYWTQHGNVVELLRLAEKCLWSLPRPWMLLIRVLVCCRSSGVNEAQCFLLNVIQLYHNCFAKWPKWKQSVRWLAVPVIISLLAKQILCCSPITAEYSAIVSFQVTTNKLFESVNMLPLMMFVILKGLLISEISILTQRYNVFKCAYFPPPLSFSWDCCFLQGLRWPHRDRDGWREDPLPSWWLRSTAGTARKRKHG